MKIKIQNSEKRRFGKFGNRLYSSLVSLGGKQKASARTGVSLGLFLAVCHIRRLQSCADQSDSLQVLEVQRLLLCLVGLAWDVRAARLPVHGHWVPSGEPN